MANKKSSDTKITRIKASDTKPAAINTVPAKSNKIAKNDESPAHKQSKLKKAGNPFLAIGGYFKGAWYELRQVRWPNRRATWGMTGALLGFVAFFAAFILLLDAAFQYLFDQLLG